MSAPAQAEIHCYTGSLNENAVKERLREVRSGSVHERERHCQKRSLCMGRLTHKSAREEATAAMIATPALHQRRHVFFCWTSGKPHATNKFLDGISTYASAALQPALLIFVI